MDIIYFPSNDFYSRAVVDSKLLTASGNIIAYVNQQDFVISDQITTTSGDLIIWVYDQDYLTTAAFIMSSGNIVSQIPIDYITNGRLLTTSGDIVSQIPSLAGYATQSWSNNTFIDTSEMTTISGDIVNKIPSLSGYATENWATQKITTASGDITSQIPIDYITQAKLTTASGDIVSQIPSLVGYATESWVSLGFISDAEMTTISGDIIGQIGAGEVTLEMLTTTSGDIVAQIGEGGGVTLAQLTTTSGDIVEQMPSLSGYATQAWTELNFISNTEMTSISGDLVAQTSNGEVTLEMLTATSGDITAYVDQQISTIEIPASLFGNIITGSGNFTVSGTAVNHYLSTTNHFTSVIPLVSTVEDTAKIGTVYIDVGLNTDIVYCTGQADAEGLPFYWMATASGSPAGLSCATCSGDTLYIQNRLMTESGVFTKGVQIGENTLRITPSGIIFPDDTEQTTAGGTGSGDVTSAQLTTISGDIVRQIYVGSDWEPPDIKRRNTSDLWIEKGRYYKGGYKYRGHYQSLDSLCSYWEVLDKFAVTATGTYIAGVSSGMLGGAVSSSLYTVYLMNNNEVMITPYVLAYNAAAVDGNTQVSFANHGSLLKSAVWNLDVNGSTAIANYTIRVVLLAADLYYDGSKIRIQVQSHTTTPNSFDHVSIVERSPGTSNGTTTPTEILFNGTSGLSLAAASTAVSDWTVFTIDQTKDYLVIFDVTSTAQNQRASQNGWSGKVTYYKATTDSWNQQNLAGASAATEVWFCIGIEVMGSSNTYVTSSGIFNDCRLLKISNDDYDGNLYTISDTVKTTTDYIQIVSDKTAEITTASWYKMLPPEGLEFVEIGIIRYSGTSISNFKKTKNDYVSMANLSLGYYSDVDSYNISSVSTSSNVPPDASIVYVLVSCSVSPNGMYANFLYLLDSNGNVSNTLQNRVGSSNYVLIMKAFTAYPFDTPGVIYHRGAMWNGSWQTVTPYTGASVVFDIVGWKM